MATAQQTLPAGIGRLSYAEQRLYERSPFNLWITTAILFAVLIGAFAVAGRIDGARWIVRNKAGATLDHRAWAAISLSLIVCSTLCLQRYSRLRDRKDASAFALALAGDTDWDAAFSPVRLRLFTAAGAIAALAALLSFVPGGVAGAARMPAVSAWFAFTSVLLGVLFFRGVELTMAGGRHTRAVIQGRLQIDLLRIEQLYPFGRAAGRTALIWFTVSAATLLLFVGSGVDIYTIALGLGCAAMGVWVFVSTLGFIHHQIRAAKATELEGVRGEIDAVRRRLDTDPAAPSKLQSLLAYEARIDAAPEWPFDQTILVRVGASALILTVPWFGQAIAGVLVEHISKLTP